MVDQSSGISGWDIGGQVGPLFGQFYHTPASMMWFWICGLANGDYVWLSGYFQDVFSSQVTVTSADTSGFAVSTLISSNYRTRIVFYGTSGYTIDVLVVGHKAEGGSAFQ